MQRLIARLLVAFVLQANLAWAADIHEALFAPGGDHHRAALSKVTDTDPHAGEVEGTPCDHCCHGSAHYVGVLPAWPSLSSYGPGGTPAPSPAVLRSRAQEPPLPPPNI